MLGTSLGHYRIVEMLGEGGMGQVYRARDTRLDRDVALKVLPPDAARSPERCERFEREARAVAALRHPNIVTIHSIDEIDGVRFLTMELVEGRTLSEIVPAGGLPVGEFLRIAVPLADAVACAHAKGIAHRDLKPANVMVDDEGRPMVLDFGVAKLWAAEAGDPEGTVAGRTGVTRPGRTVGTPAYMAPEQIAGGDVDARADLFSLGVVFHELLTGRHPFAADYPAAVMVRIVNDEAPRLEGVQAALADLVARCLSKKPEERPAGAQEIRDALRALASGTSSGTAAVTSASGSRTADPVAPELRRAMERCDWEEADRLLRATQEERSLRPEELELAVELTVWLARLDEGIGMMEKAHALYVDAGRPEDAARTALHLAHWFVEMNRPAVVRGWTKRAERLLRDRPECREHALLRRRQTMSALDECDLEGALEHNRRCEEIAERFGDEDLRIEALHDRGRILIARGDIEEGLDLIDEAMAAASAGNVKTLTRGNLLCRTLIVCRSLADYDRVREWAEIGTRWGEAHRASSYPSICRIHSAESMRQYGQWKEAEDVLRDACEYFVRFGPSSHAGEAYHELGELALRKGDLEQAEEAFRRAHEVGHDPMPGLALLRLARGDAPAARRMIERALAECPDDRLRRAQLLSGRHAISLASGDVDTADRAAAELSELAAGHGCPVFRGGAAMARGAVLLERGDAAATDALREAWETFRDARLAYDAARARVLLARAYRAGGHEEDARLHLEAARKTFADLGARPDLEAVASLVGG